MAEDDWWVVPKVSGGALNGVVSVAGEAPVFSMGERKARACVHVRWRNETKHYCGERGIN